MPCAGIWVSFQGSPISGFNSPTSWELVAEQWLCPKVKTVKK